MVSDHDSTEAGWKSLKGSELKSEVFAFFQRECNHRRSPLPALILRGLLIGLKCVGEDRCRTLGHLRCGVSFAPFRGFFLRHVPPHALRRGLHSVAALRLGFCH
jgi:hypothetical protein